MSTPLPAALLALAKASGGHVFAVVAAVAAAQLLVGGTPSALGLLPLVGASIAATVLAGRLGA